LRQGLRVRLDRLGRGFINCNDRVELHRFVDVRRHRHRFSAAPAEGMISIDKSYQHTYNQQT
jgi:hypothetical protein